MRKARLHWSWRAGIATVVAFTYGVLSLTVTDEYHQSVLDAIAGLLGGNRGGGWERGVGASVAWFLPVLLIASVVYGLLTWRLGPRGPRDGETRCRKCGYILRGITEPRCPEMG
jgi:hypothetical protein